MNLGKKLSVGAVALGFAFGGVTLGSVDQGANAAETTTSKVVEKKCGAGSCGDKKTDKKGGDKKADKKGGEKSCGAGSCGGDKKGDDKGGEKSCGSGSCG